MRPRSAILVLVAALAGCAGKNPANPDHRRSAKEQEQIDNVCGAEPDGWKQPFAADAKVIELVRGGADVATGRAIMRLVNPEPRGCDAKMYRVCRMCMELEDTGKCSYIQGGAMEFCLEKDAGVSDEEPEESEQP